MSKGTGREGRQHARQAVNLRASLRDVDQQLSANVLNLGEGGLFIRCSPPPKRWSNVTLELELAPGEHLTTAGVVVWTVGDDEADPAAGVFAGAGVQFLELSDDARSKLKAFLRRLQG